MVKPNTKPETSGTIKGKLVRGAALAATAGVLATGAGLILPHMPARTPSSAEDCGSLLDTIEAVEPNAMDKLFNDRHYKVLGMVGEAACTNIYLTTNRQPDRDGAYVEDGKLNVGDVRKFCLPTDYPGQLEIVGRETRGNVLYVNISPELQEQAAAGQHDIPIC